MVFITLIPIRRNDGSPVAGTEQDEILSGLWQSFGGVTIDGVVTGHWVDTDTDTDTDQHYQDESLRVTVACENDRLAEAEATVREIGRRLDQKSMYFEVKYFDGLRFLQIA